MDGRIRAEGQMQETGEVERRTLHEDLEDAIDQTDPCIDVDDGTDEIAMEPVEGDNVDDPTIRHSTRRTKPPSRFANAVMIGLQAARFFNNYMSWDNLTPLEPLLEIRVVSLEQDVSGPRFLSRQEAPKLNRSFAIGI
jgi:hypothetical protein